MSSSSLTNTVGDGRECTPDGLPHAEIQRSRWMQIPLKQHVERDLRRFQFSVYLPQDEYPEHADLTHPKEKSSGVWPCEAIEDPVS